MFLAHIMKSKNRRALNICLALLLATAPLSCLENDPLNLTACLFVERNAPSLFYDFDPPREAAVELAREYVNDMLFPEKMTLQVVTTDLGPVCEEKNHVVAIAMRLRAQGVICNVYIGPGCGYSAESLYDMASYFDTLIIGCPAAGVGTRDNLDKYPNLARMSITHTDTTRNLLRFLKQQNYTTPVIVRDHTKMRNGFYDEMGIVVEKFIKVDNYALHTSTKYIDIAPHTRTDEIIEKQILLYKDRTRGSPCFLVGPVNNLVAHRLGMTSGEYLYYGVNLFESPTFGSTTAWTPKNPTMREAFRPLLLASLSQNSIDPREFDVFKKTVTKMADKKRLVEANPDPNEVDFITTHFYDAVIFYGSLVRDVMKTGRNFTSANELFAIYTHNYTFYSPLSGRLRCDRNGDRLSSYTLGNFDFKTGTFQAYLEFGYDGTSKQLKNLTWPNGDQLPPNRPHCGFLGDDPICAKHLSTGETLAAVLVPLSLLLFCTLGGAIYFSRYISSVADPYWWRISDEDLTIALPRRSFKASNVSITINRRASGSTYRDTASSKGDGETILLTASKKHVTYEGELIRAAYKDHLVELRKLSNCGVRVSKAIGASLLPIRHLQHENIQRFFGIAVSSENICEYIVGERCTKETLTRLLLRESITLDWIFQGALFKDSAAGITYLHSTKLVSLGNLSSHNCLIHSNFVLKICDYGLSYFHDDAELAPLSESDGARNYEQLLWRAPELLRQRMPLNGSQVKKGTIPPLRPRFPQTFVEPDLRDLVAQCWDEVPLNRPPFRRIWNTLNVILGKSGSSIVDHLLSSMEKTAAQLEFQAEERTVQFMDEKRRSDDILVHILPKSVAEKLTKGEIVLPEIYDSITVHFSDVDGFAELIETARTPRDTVHVLNALYAICDEVIDQFEVYKVETVRDAYLVVSGLPIRNGIQHADHITSMGLKLRHEIDVMKVSIVTKIKLSLRIGIHSGSCVAAIIGTRLPKYCLFGDTVNTSSRMESHGQPGKIQCSQATKELLDVIGGYWLRERGEINIKGKGAMKTHWVIGKRTAVKDQISLVSS